jgi:predicted outer membrane repeat protein
MRIRFGLVLALSSMAASVAGATDITVTRLDDPAPAACLPNDCSLREAVITANALPGADRILLPAGTLQLTIVNTTPNPTVLTGDLDLTDDVEIIGAGSAATSIIAVNNDRIFNITPSNNVTLRNMTLGGGHGSFGGAILQNGGLTIEDAILGNNVASSDGGAIRNSGPSETVLRRVQILNNVSAGNGGAIYTGSAGALIVDSTLSGNHAVDGGAVYGYTARVYRSLIQNNQASGNGGGLYGKPGCSCTLLEVHESTFAGNSAVDGGGIYANNPLVVDLSTFSGNHATGKGGAFHTTNTGGSSAIAPIHIYSSTLYLNTAAFGGSAVYFYNDAAGYGVPPDFRNTLISGNCLQEGAGTGTFYGMLGNIESPGDTCGMNNVVSHNNVPAGNLMLGALGDNGGPTLTHLPMAGSAAINAGWNSVCTALDQRGYVRVDGTCDSGSVEAGALDDVIFRDSFDL